MNPAESSKQAAASPQPVAESGSDVGSTHTIRTDGFQDSTSTLREGVQTFSARESPFTTKTTSASHTSRPVAPDSLAPFALLRKSTTAGNYTIANILNADEEEHGGDETVRLDDRMTDGWPIDMNDPVNENLLSLPVAQDLFDKYVSIRNELLLYT